MTSKYFLPEGYVENLNNAQYDDTSETDEWQNEVYEIADKLVTDNKLTSVVDLGCGSGFKLNKFFAGTKKLGIDLEKTVKFLRNAYPDGEFKIFNQEEPVQADLIISSDVIEHVPNLDEFIGYIEKSEFKFIVISTPDRNSRRDPSKSPPINRSHCREWTEKEFEQFMRYSFGDRVLQVTKVQSKHGRKRKILDNIVVVISGKG